MNEIAVTVLDYPISWLELIATASGLLSVWLAVRNSVLTWPVGLVNVVGFGLLFYRFRLYSDVLLQVFFFLSSLYGWYGWRARLAGPALPISRLTSRQRGGILFLILAGTQAQCWLMLRAPAVFPLLFPEPAAHPYPDALTTVASVVATLLLARRKLESWWCWVLVDVVAIYVYFSRGILLVAWEYVVFLGMAVVGGIHWYYAHTRSTSTPDQ